MTPTTPTPRRTRSKPADTAPDSTPAPSAIEEQQAQQVTPRENPSAGSPETNTPGSATQKTGELVAPAPAGQAARPSPATKVTKVAQLQALLAAPEGATLAQLCNALGWQSHTVRAALTRLRQAGHSVERSRTDDGQTVYRILPNGPGEATPATGNAPVATEVTPMDGAANGADEDADADLLPGVSAASRPVDPFASEPPVEVTFSSKRAASAFAALQDGERV